MFTWLIIALVSVWDDSYFQLLNQTDLSYIHVTDLKAQFKCFSQLRSFYSNGSQFNFKVTCTKYMIITTAVKQSKFGYNMFDLNWSLSINLKFTTTMGAMGPWGADTDWWQQVICLCWQKSKIKKNTDESDLIILTAITLSEIGYNSRSHLNVVHI